LLYTLQWRQWGGLAPGDTIQGYFVAEFTRNTGQTMLEGGEGGNGEVAMRQLKRSSVCQMPKLQLIFVSPLLYILVSLIVLRNAIVITYHHSSLRLDHRNPLQISVYSSCPCSWALVFILLLTVIAQCPSTLCIKSASLKIMKKSATVNRLLNCT